MTESQLYKKESLKMGGYVEVYVKDLTTGEVKKHCEGHNVITTAVHSVFASWIAGNSKSTAFTHVAIGTGSTAESAAQTTLVTEVYRKGIGFISSAVAVVTTETSFGSLEANGNSIYEAGLFTAAAAGTMLSRYKFASAVTKTVNVELIVKWTITVS